MVSVILQEFFLMMPIVGFKDLNPLTDNKLFLIKTFKNKEQTYEKLMEMSKIDRYTLRNLLDYSSKLL